MLSKESWINKRPGLTMRSKPFCKWRFPVGREVPAVTDVWTVPGGQRRFCSLQGGVRRWTGPTIGVLSFQSVYVKILHGRLERHCSASEPAHGSVWEPSLWCGSVPVLLIVALMCLSCFLCDPSPSELWIRLDRRFGLVHSFSGGREVLNDSAVWLKIKGPDRFNIRRKWKNAVQPHLCVIQPSSGETVPVPLPQEPPVKPVTAPSRDVTSSLPMTSSVTSSSMYGCITSVMQ